MTRKKQQDKSGQSPGQNQEKKYEKIQEESKQSSQEPQSPAENSTDNPQSQSKTKDSVSSQEDNSRDKTESKEKKDSNSATRNTETGSQSSEEEEQTQEAPGSILGSLLGKMLSTGENQIKRAAELKLPREVINFSKEQMKGLKHDMVKTVGSEVSNFLKNLNLGKELVKVLTYLTFEVKMQIRLVPSDENKLKIKPESKIKVASKKSKPQRDNESQK